MKPCSSSAVFRALTTVIASAWLTNRCESLKQACLHSSCKERLIDPDGIKAPSLIITAAKDSTRWHTIREHLMGWLSVALLGACDQT